MITLILLKITMKRSANEPSTSTGKRGRPTHFTLQQVMEALDDSEGDEAVLLHQYDYSSSSDVDMDRDLDSDRSSDDDDDRSRARPTVMERGRVHQTDFRGDNVPDDGWTATFASPTIDLNFNEDGTGPINIPESLTEESSCVDFLFLFVEDDFWQNLTNKTNLRAQQVPCPQRHTPGNHWPEIPEVTASNHVCTVCLEKTPSIQQITSWSSIQGQPTQEGQDQRQMLYVQKV